MSGYTPSAFGAECHACEADEILIGGAAGAGKSVILLHDPFDIIVSEHQRFVDDPAYRSQGWMIHLRRESSMLAQTIAQSKMAYPDLDSGAKFNNESKTWTFSSGLKLVFAGLKDNDDFLKHRSKAYVRVYFDELHEFTKAQYEGLVSRVRIADPQMKKQMKVMSCTNPGPGWVKEMFYDPAPQARVMLKSKRKLSSGETRISTRIFIAATLHDNPDRDFAQDYETRLLGLPWLQRQQLLYGDWEAVDGAYFQGLIQKGVHIVPNFEVPSNWFKFRMGDWGFKSHGVILWAAIGSDGEMVVYRELTFKGKDAVQVAEVIREIEMANGEWNNVKRQSRLSGPMDNGIWAKTGTRGPTIAEDMINAGVMWEKCTKNRSQAAMQVVKRLNGRTGPKGHEVPMLRITEGCVRLIKTIMALPTDKNDSEVPKKGGMDHWYDALSYGCVYRAMQALGDGQSYYDPSDDMFDELAARRNTKKRDGWGNVVG